ncbi:adenine phosphoribosyltransferase [Thermotoga sp.]|uniref:adenine phosphoribosyltransferase n=1 Tax=Thermotoga sp. TaxID=28240 RepID=UPI0025E84195|nr:adenine phosphoribosyltransferase [Thermotoga sp.]MCD6552291.1 adenine phosphoribosyltransferase [Thermotoga sp.]
MDLKQFIRDIPNFPQKGIIFRDITPLLKDSEAFSEAINRMCELVADREFDLIVAPEARGFILGAAMAYKLGKGFVPVRKPGKLPYKTVYAEYQLEYGIEQLHIHEDAIEKGQKVLIVDDVLATGGTAEALIRLVKKLGGEISALAFLVELSYLEPRKRLEGYDLKTLIVY